MNQPLMLTAAQKAGPKVTIAVGAVILILALIILFIQKRPQGLFALKGRVID